ncbi:MAG: molybdopterin-dependent oxidoreductase, partial [Proteobacteria bacterium]|nr:molybdopterin-dependent oxidoreductase [Pseudomonadota bacterium]
SQGYDAIFLAVGAWNSYKLGIPGEDLPGVMSAIEFLIRTASGDPPPVGKKVIIIGNGNTGMDAARSCLRMGAKEVIMLYRRTKAEMPANPQEIHDAEQEGIKIHILATPTRIVSKDGRFSGVEYLENELKAADSSGRPSPVPIKGSETIIEADQAIVSIGQFSDMAFLKNDSELKDIAFTKKGIPETDSNTLQSCLPYLFLGGDLLRGPRTVIQASADGREAALSIHSYLTDGVVIKDAKPFNITKGKLKEVDPVNFENIISRPRHSTPLLSVEQRVKSFEEAELVLTESQAKAEAERCLSCGCLDSFDCLLRKYATIYNVDASKLTFWKSPKYKIENSHPFITVDPNKCIVCRRCAVGCDNYQIQYAIKVDEVSSENRIGPPQYAPNINDKCVDCGLCAGNCPTGALQEKIKGKPGPFELKKIRTTCTYCGVGCQIYLGVSGGEVVNVEGVSGVAPNFGHLCVKGRFAYDFIHSPERLRYPMIKQDDGSFRQASWEEALDLVARQLSSVRDEYGPDTIGALTSARVTNEENYLFQKLARAVFKTNNVDHCARLCHASTVAGLAAAFGSGAMTNTIGDIEEADVILLTGSNITENHPVISSNIKRAIKFKGTKLIVVDPRRINMTYFSRNWLRQNLGTDVAWINGMMHVIIKEELFDKSFVENRTTNFEELTKAVKKYTPEYVESITGIPSQSL